MLLSLVRASAKRRLAVAPPLVACEVHVKNGAIYCVCACWALASCASRRGCLYCSPLFSHGTAIGCNGVTACVSVVWLHEP